MTNTACMLGNITNKMYLLSKALLTWFCLGFNVTHWTLKYGIWFWFAWRWFIFIMCAAFDCWQWVWLLEAVELSFSQKFSSGLTSANFPRCSITAHSSYFIRTLINSLLTLVMIGLIYVFKWIICFQLWFTFTKILMWFVIPFHWWLGSPDIFLSCV